MLPSLVVRHFCVAAIPFQHVCLGFALSAWVPGCNLQFSLDRLPSKRIPSTAPREPTLLLHRHLKQLVLGGSSTECCNEGALAADSASEHESTALSSGVCNCLRKAAFLRSFLGSAWTHFGYAYGWVFGGWGKRKSYHGK